MARAVTFDLWDTLVVDDSDEPVRAARGLPTKVEARSASFAALVAPHGVAAERARAAWSEADAAFRRAWKHDHVTPHLRDRVVDALARLGLGAVDGTEALVEQIASQEVDIPPRACDGAREALAALKADGWRLGIVSDAIVTPGSHLRRLLAAHGLDGFFDVFVFSDEAGASKPSPRVFALAAEGLGVAPSALVHVGDREANDIAGPHGVGARAVLYVGARDRRGAEGTAAERVCDDLRALPAQLATLSAEGA